MEDLLTHTLEEHAFAVGNGSLIKRLLWLTNYNWRKLTVRQTTWKWESKQWEHVEGTATLIERRNDREGGGLYWYSVRKVSATGRPKWLRCWGGQMEVSQYPLRLVPPFDKNVHSLPTFFNYIIGWILGQALQGKPRGSRWTQRPFVRLRLCWWHCDPEKQLQPVCGN